MTVYGSGGERQGPGPSHRLLIRAVPPGSRVLDVGCAEGYLARELRARGCTIVGVEYEAAAAEVACEVCEHVVVGDVQSEVLRAEVSGPFDRILFGDVLEHLPDAVGTLAWTRELLAPDGRAVISLPTIAHWTGRREVARGRFPYSDHGLFDRTHVRFYTRETARELVHEAGFEGEREQFAPGPLPLESRVPHLDLLRPAFLRTAPELFALQVVLTCRPAGRSPSGCRPTTAPTASSARSARCWPRRTATWRS